MEFEKIVKEHVPLAPLTTLHVGGPARYLAEVDSPEALAEGIRWARGRGLPIFVLGGGSNVVVADEGFPGLVLHMQIRGVSTQAEGDDVIVRAGAGEEWDALVALTVEHGWAGFECLSGIPGFVGATPVQNVGAYGQETAETLLSVDALDLTNDRMVSLDAAECEFGYRSSRFKTREPGRFIITAVTYRLRAGGDPAVRYPELKRYLDEHAGDQPGLKAVRKAVITIRARKAMVIDPHDPDSCSAGSFFVNPVVTPEEFEQVKRRASHFVEAHHNMPAFPSPGGVKLSAAWLIERAGIARGFVHGGVGTSTKHSLAIINRGSGTAREVAELAALIQSRVREQFGVTLVPEPIFVGVSQAKRD